MIKCYAIIPKTITSSQNDSMPLLLSFTVGLLLLGLVHIVTGPPLS
jgi:hypothetical protein